jgi:hypothetical protein
VTSEVLILNKRGIVLGADSAVTTSGGEHPRYSKSANKIFDLSHSGTIAAAIFGNALVDLVPWELALKLFRRDLGDCSLDTAADYSSALMAFLSGNDTLFPKGIREGWVQSQFDEAIRVVLEEAKLGSQLILDSQESEEVRRAAWSKEVIRIEALLDQQGIAPNLSEDRLKDVLSDIAPWVSRAQEQLNAVEALQVIDASDLARLGHKMRYALPNRLLANSGLVVAGYGNAQIFPAYDQLEVYGHVGDELYYRRVRNFEVSHTSSAMIQPLAQSSMIEMFTDGFGPSLEAIIKQQGISAFKGVFAELAEHGIGVEETLANEIVSKCHGKFMEEWKRENWKQNFHPLISVLQSLSIQEMAHLAESLLGLESLKERVTSPTESVGGPIDVAAITKSEGLVWIKRKHYFDASLNMRYSARVGKSLG